MISTYLQVIGKKIYIDLQLKKKRANEKFQEIPQVVSLSTLGSEGKLLIRAHAPLKDNLRATARSRYRRIV